MESDNEDGLALINELIDKNNSNLLQPKSSLSAREILEVIFKGRLIEFTINSMSELEEYNRLYSNLNVIKSRDNKLIRQLDLLEQQLIIKKLVSGDMFPITYTIWAEKAPAPKRYSHFVIKDNDG